MKEKNLWLLCGCPASGKSTYCGFINGTVVSRDAIRFKLIKDDDEYFAKEKQVYNEFVREIQTLLDNGKDVIADVTHLNEASRNKLLDRLNLENVKINCVNFITAEDVCLSRNEKREGRARVPRSVLRRMYSSFDPAKHGEKYEYNLIINDITNEE